MMPSSKTKQPSTRKHRKPTTSSSHDKLPQRQNSARYRERVRDSSRPRSTERRSRQSPTASRDEDDDAYIVVEESRSRSTSRSDPRRTRYRTHAPSLSALPQRQDNSRPRGDNMPAASTSSSSSSRSASKRLLRELATWEKEARNESGIERLGPVSEDELLHWEAVINGRGIGAGYDDGRWLIQIQIPPSYPLAPPKMTFATPVVHANIALETGEICLDLLKDAWTPAYSVLECVRAVRMLLSCPETDSPLNIDVAALIRSGDALGARRLVEFWVEDDGGRYEGR